MASINNIRTTFLDYFVKNNHTQIPSSPLIPKNDPSLMFTNAGMVQFKNIFTGTEKPPAPAAVTAQKCVRAGGKHNDLENVGYTARHHTFFEMLGNFSFGNYFKQEAIALAWNLVTKEFGLPSNKLYITIYHDDIEAENYWKKIANLPSDRIIKIATDDNFWRMGDTGPCGPCSEIFYDHGDHIQGGLPGSADEDGDRFVEIWNLVFMQYEQISTDNRINLPKASIDTGMGIERIAAILQGKHNNYDTDIFAQLMAETAELFGKNITNHTDSYKVIADHLRAISFLIADGVLPANEGRGYVLRRIMRRAMRHAHIIGGKRQPMLYLLISTVTNLMGSHYHELYQAENLIRETLKSEENRFQNTLSRGLKLLEDEISSLSKGDKLDGKVAFTLYDTFGFPLDLTADILRGRNLSLDMYAFNVAMQEQRTRARAAWKGSGTQKADSLWFHLKEKTPTTEFLGYQHQHNEALIQHIIKDHQENKNVIAGEDAILIVNQTVFYGESGGQLGDIGIIYTSEGDNITKFTVTDTQKTLGLILHYGKMIQGSLTCGEHVQLNIDTQYRSQLMRHHSATHLLQQALRDTLGNHVAQSGSLVAKDYLRFDFSYTGTLTEPELQKIEMQVNQEILYNNPVTTLITDKATAIKSGALALFGEKYDNEVRVVTMGSFRHTDNKNYSVELCGGTHVQNTAEIGMFKILNESGIAAGIRRIEAVAGEALMKHFEAASLILKNASTLLKTKPENIPDRLEKLQLRIKEIENENKNLRRKISLNNDINYDKIINNIPVTMRQLDCTPKDLKTLCSDFRNQQTRDGIVILGTIFEKRASLMIQVAHSLTGQYNAVDLVTLGAKIIDGQGGGKKDLAQSGGKNCDGLPNALNEIMQFIANKK